MSKKLLWSLVVLLASLSVSALPATEPLKKLVIVAGRPSHPPRMHEFNAGVQLLHKCLAGSAVEPHFVLNGWPEDESIFNDAAAVVFYMDGGKGHEVVKQEGRRLKMIEQWAQKGVGLGFMHFGVEVVPDQAGAEFKRWIGGHYEHEHSCNPIWEASFESFPDHPVARGVKPFKIKDEWYFNIRFAGDIAGNQPTEVSGLKFVPILVASPTDETRDGPYVYPKGPYKHIQANKGRAETMMWTVERTDGGRGMGFTGGHFHDNWANENYRKVILNSFYWLAKVDVPKDGVVSLAATDINANLDPKGK
jgi:type 1 glutamine amidotransferase